MMDTWGLVFCLVFITKNIQAFKDGATSSPCLNRYPEHGGIQARQDNPPPYRVIIDKNVYNPGDVLTVSVQSTDPKKHRFKGIVLLAHGTTPGAEVEIVGTFQSFTPKDKLKFVSCEGVNQSAVTHKNDKEVSSVQVNWEAPSHYLGPIVFEATVVESYSVFYVNLRSYVLLPGNNSLVRPYLPVTHVSDIRPITRPIDWDWCGKTKGCLLYPQYCQSHCVVALSFRVLNHDSVRFEMTTMKASYVSVGFSDDRTMGNELTITCTDNLGRTSIQYGYNHKDRYNIRQSAVNLTDLEVNVEDGRLSCRFTLPVVIANTMAINGEIEETDLMAKEFYLLLAWGDTYLSSDTIRGHKEFPVISNAKISIKDVDIFRGSCIPTLVKYHAILMCLAWLAFAPLAIFTARYYKKGFKHKTVVDFKIWQIIHGTASLLTVTLTLGSLVAISVHLNGKVSQKDTSYNHVSLGFTVIALMLILLMTSLYVPGPSSRARPIFNGFHRVMGAILLLLAAISIYDAYEMDGFSTGMRQFCKSAVKMWAGFAFILVICLEGYQYLMAKYTVRKLRSDQYNLDQLSIRSLRLTPEEIPNPSHILYGFIIFFFLSSVILSLCMILFF